MYTRVSVGTAKPSDWARHSIPHHLFDICDQPIDFDVVKYRERICAVVADIQARGKIAILVGGSLFYIKSLFFPPHEARSNVEAIPPSVRQLPMGQLWNHLHQIDPVRAAQIHQHDVYRVIRALAIWYDLGLQPSLLIPQFTVPFPVSVFFLSPPLEVLYDRINSRTKYMINEMGWIDEVESLMADELWKQLITKKGFIGYDILMLWIEVGKPADQLDQVIRHIQQETRNYAKRQRTFWRSFARQLEEAQSAQCVVRECETGDSIVNLL
jgi:tRNA dimethylallyltransferase